MTVQVKQTDTLQYTNNLSTSNSNQPIPTWNMMEQFLFLQNMFSCAFRLVPVIFGDSTNVLFVVVECY